MPPHPFGYNYIELRKTKERRFIMNILVIGGGGREHTIIKKLKENPGVEKIYALPGNGGIAQDAECVNVKATDLEGIVNFIRGTKIDYAVVAPDDPLVLGCVDLLEAEGIPCFGPRKNAAIIEGSKVFSKDLMKKYGIPTAAYEVFTDPADALAYLETAPIPTVVKADKSGDRIVIEEYLEGPEVSVLSFTDGTTVKPMVSSMDHKRAGDGDTGPNTGGMGTVAPNPFYTEEVAERCMETIFLPTIRAMKAEGREFRGCLYFGLMITKDGPKVIEYNCRFGDPETQVVLPLLESDLLTVMQAVTEGKLSECEVKFRDAHACCVVLASKGYPLSYEKGYEITIPDEVKDHVFVAGAVLKDGKLVTSGGRVLGVTAVADTLPEAVKEAYAMAETVTFGNRYMRKDIGQRAIKGCQ